MTTQYERFFFWLGQLMSGNATNPSSVNPQQQYRKIENPAIRTGKIGKYQMTENQMATLGYYILADGDNGLANKWQGTWTGRRSIKSLDDFLNTPDTQELIIREAMRQHWRLIRRHHLDELVGTKARGVLLTESTLLAIAHLMGDESVAGLAPQNKAAGDLGFGALALIAGFQTPYNVTPNQNYYQQQFEQFLANGTPITLNPDLAETSCADVSQYTWCTQCDNKVRACHAAKEAETFCVSEEPSPGEEENCRCFREDHIDDADTQTIEKQALNIKNSRLTSSIKTYADAVKLQIENAANHLGANGECVALVRNLCPDLPKASEWVQRDLVQGNLSIRVGTPIATFNFYGKAGTNGYGPADSQGGQSKNSHSGLYLGQSDAGLTILDQWKSSDGVMIHTIPWSAWKGNVNEGGSKYYTITY